MFIFFVKKFVVSTEIGLFVLLLSGNLYAATYYIDFVGGSDSNIGTSTRTPFKHAPGDSNATDTAASSSLSAGDTVYFKGGVKYDGTITISSSGSSDINRIIFDGNSAENWGMGKAIIDGNGTRNTCFSFSGVQSYVTINYFEIRNGREAVNQGRLIYDTSGSSYINITNNTIHDAGSPDVATVSGVGIWMNGGTYWDISGNTFYDCYDTAISIYPGSYNNIHDNEIYDKIIWGIRIASNSGDSSTDNSIYDNIIHDIWYYDDLGPHTDYVFLNIPDNQTGTISNTKIYRNLFYTNHAWGRTYGGTAMIFAQASGTGTINNTYIWSNIFSNPHSAYCVEMDGGNGAMNNIYLYNNSYNMPTDSDHAFIYAKLSRGNMSGLIIKNNTAKTGSGPLIWVQSGITGVEIDYNNWNSSNSNPFKVGSTYYNWSGWKGLGYDTYGKGPNSDPLYTNADPTHWNLTVPPNSPLINAGTDLGPEFDTDYLGVPRPQGTGWNIGAYELLAPPPPLNPSTSK